MPYSELIRETKTARILSQSVKRILSQSVNLCGVPTPIGVLSLEKRGVTLARYLQHAVRQLLA